MVFTLYYRNTVLDTKLALTPQATYLLNILIITIRQWDHLSLLDHCASRLGTRALGFDTTLSPITSCTSWNSNTLFNIKNDKI